MRSHSRAATAATLAFAVAGVLLFIFTLRQAGLGAIADLIRRVGWGGFSIILLLSLVRLVARSVGWMQCVEGETRLRFTDAFSATLMGEALGNLTPFATVLSEPAKAVLVRERVPLPVAFSAIVVENIVYAASVALMIVAGAIAFLSSYDMEPALRLTSLGAIGGMLMVIVAAIILLGTRAAPVSRLIERLSAGRVLPSWLSSRAAEMRRFEERIGSFGRRNRGRLVPLALCEATFHAAGVAEVCVVLLLAAPGSAPTLLAALILESTGRLIGVAFRFVPLRVGVDEAGSGLVTLALGLGTAAGVTLGLVRKARLAVWTGIGVALLLQRGLSVRRALDEAAAAKADGQSA